MAKFITAKEAAQLIPDHATVGVAGMGLSGWPEEIACAIRDNFAETGHPCDLNLKQASALGDWGYGNKFHGWDRNPLPEADTDHGNRGVTRFGEAGPGLITKWTVLISEVLSRSAIRHARTRLKPTACHRVLSSIFGENVQPAGRVLLPRLALVLL